MPLGAVLERAKLKVGAVDVVLMGADRGAINSDPPSPGVIHFDRGIPLAKAKADETLLAWEMNKGPLPVSHGARNSGDHWRLVWHGVSEVAHAHRGDEQAACGLLADHRLFDLGSRRDASPQLLSIAAIEPKAIITSLGPNDILQAGKTYTIKGLAWAGEQRVKAVELSTDGGKTWLPAVLPSTTALTWSRWSIEFTPNSKGPLQLLARCTDARGRTQDAKRDPDRRNYMINHLVPVELMVK